MSGLSGSSTLQDVVSVVDNLVVSLKPLTDAIQAGNLNHLTAATASPQGGAAAVSLGAPGASGSSAGVSSLQEVYATIKDSVSSNQLPPGWKLNESQKGITQDHKDAFFIVKDAARYAETSLKYLISLDVDKEAVSKEDIANLVVVQRALLELLGDKYAALRVKSATKNKQVGTLFESQLAGTSGLSPRHIEIWQNVAQIGANGGFTDRDQFNQRSSRGGRGRGYRGRGGYRSGGRGFNDYMQDVPPRRFDNNDNP